MKPCKYELPIQSIEFGGRESTEKTEYECTKYKNPNDCPLDILCNFKKQKIKEDKLNKLIEQKEKYYQRRSQYGKR